MKIYCLHCGNDLGYPTIFYANQILARNALREKRNKIKHRVNFIVEDSDDVFAFIGGGWASYRVDWRVREIEVIES